jgi:hypothetical protein
VLESSLNGGSIPTELFLRIEEKESGEVVRDTTFGREGVRNYIPGFQGSQAVPARPSGRGNAYDWN